MSGSARIHPSAKWQISNEGRYHKFWRFVDNSIGFLSDTSLERNVGSLTGPKLAQLRRLEKSPPAASPFKARGIPSRRSW